MPDILFLRNVIDKGIIEVFLLFCGIPDTTKQQKYLNDSV